MIRSIVGRVVASVAAAALVVGAGVVAGSGVATASEASKYYTVSKTFENILVSWSGLGSMNRSAYVQAGQEIRFGTRIQVIQGAERVLTRITSHGPAGFEYVPGSAQMSADGAGGMPPGSVTQEIGPGTVSVTAPEGGWALTPGGGRAINLYVTYRAPQNIPPGTEFGTGVTFDVAGHEGSVGWPDMGKVTIVADPDPFGFGSLADPFGSSGGKGYPQGNL